MRTWYYARDGRQFGPVGIEEIKRLLATGGLEPDDLAWKDGMAEWVPISGIAELSPLAAVETPPPLPPDDPSPYAPPLSREETPSPETSQPDIPPGSEPLQFMGCLNIAGRMMAQHARTLFGAGLLYLAAVLFSDYLASRFDEMTHFAPTWIGALPESVRKGLENSVFVSRSPFMLIAQTLFEWYLDLGLFQLGLDIACGRKPDILTLFRGYRVFGRFVIANILYGLMVMTGAVFLILPGLFLAVMFSPFVFVILDRKMTILESFSYAARLTRHSRTVIGLLTLTTGVVYYLMATLLPLGLVLIIPFAVMLQTATYRWLTRGSERAYES